MKSPIAITLIAALALACTDTSNPLTAPDAISPAQGNSGVVMVTNSNDAGPASLRAAIDEANASTSISKIQIHPKVGTIFLQTPIVFTGSQDLEIKGHKGAIDGSALEGTETNLLANGGGDLEISSLTFQNAPGNGLTIQVPPTADGTQNVSLRDVAAIDNDGHGIEINDQEDPDDAGNPDATPQIRGNSNGSDASLDVTVDNCTFDGNGFGSLDRDGLRINEGGLGNLTVSISRSRAVDNGADGVELDERGEGSVTTNVFRSHFARNGDFDQSPVPDKDDGMDVDETDAGDLVANVSESTANDNFEEGFDFNENDAGDMRIEMQHVEASRNAEEGIDLEEDDDFRNGGDMIATLSWVKANGNGTSAGDGGIKIRERTDGDMIVRIDNAEATENVIAGIHMREQDAGSMNSMVTNTHAHDNGANGILQREDDAGNLVSQIANSSANGNTAVGIVFDENGDGNLLPTISLVRASENGGAGTNGVDADEAGLGDLIAVVDQVSAMGNSGHGMNLDENAAGNLDVTVSNSLATGNALFGIRVDQAVPGTAVFHLSTSVLTPNTGGTTTGNVPPAP